MNGLKKKLFDFLFPKFSLLAQKYGDFRPRIRNLREKCDPEPAGNVWKPISDLEYDEITFMIGFFLNPFMRLIGD